MRWRWKEVLGPESKRTDGILGKKTRTILLIFLVTILNFSVLTTPVHADPENFTLKWSMNYGFQSYSSPVAQDINGDGIAEIFVGGRHSSGAYSGIFCINSLNGNIIWSKTFRTLQSYHVPIAIGDLDNDGDYELVHAAGSRTIARNCEDGSIFWNVSTDSGWGVPAIVDLDGTGIPYVIVGDNSGFDTPVTLSKLYGNNGAVAASSTRISYTCYGGVSVADLDRDGDYEIMMSDSGDSICFDEDLNELWSTTSYTSESHCAVLVNVTGDADLEVVIMKQAGEGVEDGGIYVYYADGSLVPGKYSSDLGLTAHCQPAVYDIDKDGNVELITAYDHATDVWDLGTWSLDATLERGPEPPDIADVLGDSDLEIISPFAFSDDDTDIYDSSYDNPADVRNYVGLNTLVYDTDGDGLNELIIHSYDGSMSLFDTLAVTPSPSQRGDTPYYSERRTNAGVYIPKIGEKSEISNLNIADESTGVSLSTSTLSVSINEPNGDPLYWTVETSPNVGKASGFAESNGTKTCSISNLDPSTTYTWYVNATDGTNWKVETYQFTTEDESYDGSDFFVDGTHGNDGNDGSFSSPWKTIQHAADTLEAGDTVYIKAGVYHEYINPWSGMNSGTQNNWITYTNYQNDEVIIDGTGGSSDWTGILKMDNQEYIRIDNIHFRNSCSHGILIHDDSGDSSNIVISNCTFSNCSDSAIDIKGYHAKLCDVLVENNIIVDTQNGWNDIGEPSDESITLSNVDRFIVRNNVMYDNHKISIDAKSGSQNGLIYNNRIDTTGSWVCQWGTQGIYVDAQDLTCKNISIFNNIVWGNGTGFEFATEQGGSLSDIRVYNNIYNGSNNGFQINDHTSVPGSHLKTNFSFVNNVCSDDTSICVQITDKDSSFNNLTIRNNIFCGSIGINIGSDLDLSDHNVDHNLFDTSSGSDYYGSFSVISAPLFLNPDIGNYSLQPNSPAIDAGISTYAPTVDFNGVPRPQGSSFDIGAFELCSSSDNIDPSVSDITLSNSDILDTNPNLSWENISCEITDNVGIDTVLIYITNPNDADVISQMTQLGSTDIYFYNVSWTIPGTYAYHVWSNDTNNNDAQSEIDTFYLPPNWDINKDKVCNLVDMQLVANLFQSAGNPGWIREDVDNDGVIKVLDIVIVSSHLGENLE